MLHPKAGFDRPRILAMYRPSVPSTIEPISFQILLPRGRTEEERVSFYFPISGIVREHFPANGKGFGIPCATFRGLPSTTPSVSRFETKRMHRTTTSTCMHIAIACEHERNVPFHQLAALSKHVRKTSATRPAKEDTHVHTSWVQAPSSRHIRHTNTRIRDSDAWK